MVKIWSEGWDAGWIYEGQFVDSQLDGFGRSLDQYGFFFTIGFHKNGKKHGFAKSIGKGAYGCGGALFEHHVLKKKEEVQSYDPDTDRIAKPFDERWYVKKFIW